jgi:hypothetical protein
MLHQDSKKPTQVIFVKVSIALTTGGMILAAAIYPASSQSQHQSTLQASTTSVPFVGCTSDGQLGPEEAPAGTSKTLAIPPESAKQLAYYQGHGGLSVLAPRGWNCFSTYGSNGINLYVSSQPIDASKFFSTSWKGFSEPAITLALSHGGTSGRFEVAQIIARVFPTHRGFVQSVIAEGIESKNSFPLGPYPTDKLTYLSHDVVEYQTPPHSDGLGTRSVILKSADPIGGVAILTEPETSLTQLAVRLPPSLQSLEPIIIHQVETDATSPTN